MGVVEEAVRFRQQAEEGLLVVSFEVAVGRSRLSLVTACFQTCVGACLLFYASTCVASCCPGKETHFREVLGDAAGDSGPYRDMHPV